VITLISQASFVDGEEEGREKGGGDGRGEEGSQNGADDAARRETISLLLRLTPLRGQGQPGHGQGQTPERHLLSLGGSIQFDQPIQICKLARTTTPPSPVDITGGPLNFVNLNSLSL